LIFFLNAKNKGAANKGPLHWCDQFVARADQAGAITPEQFAKLSDAFYGASPRITMSPRIRRGHPARFEISYGNHWNLPNVELVKALRSVKLKDGTEVALLNEEGKPAKAGAADELSSDHNWEIKGSAILDIEPGAHELTFVVDVGLLDENTKPQVVHGKPGQLRHWPTGRARFVKETIVPLTVVAQDAAIVDLVTDPSLDPQATGTTITAKSAKVTRGSKGVRLRLEMEVQSPKVPLSCDVLTTIAGKEQRLGNLVAYREGTSGSTMQVDLAALPADVTSIDVVLRPNIAHAERVPGVDRAWGKPVEIRNIKLERYDLEAEAAKTGEAGAAK
jgi:hypothetical protein